MPITFKSDGTLEIYTDQIAYLGEHSLHISASLVDYSDMTSLTVTLLPLKFIRCPVAVEEWSSNDLTIPSSPASAIQEISLPVFSYTENGFDCQYFWADIDFQVFQGDSLEQDITDLATSSYLQFDHEALKFTFNAQPQLRNDLTITVKLVASLSDELTQA